MTALFCICTVQQSLFNLYNFFTSLHLVRQDGQVLRVLAGRDRPERVDRSLQGDAEKEGAGRQAQALLSAAGTAGQAGPLRSPQPAQR